MQAGIRQLEGVGDGLEALHAGAHRSLGRRVIAERALRQPLYPQAPVVPARRLRFFERRGQLPRVLEAVPGVEAERVTEDPRREMDVATRERVAGEEGRIEP